VYIIYNKVFRVSVLFTAYALRTLDRRLPVLYLYLAIEISKSVFENNSSNMIRFVYEPGAICYGGVGLGSVESNTE
jgi:hypothetical protein